MELYKLALLFTLLNIIYAQDSNKHMICKEVNDVFSNQDDGSYSRRQLQGPSGKRGQPGAKGEPGSPGSKGQPGIVDYDRLTELVRIEVGKKTEEMAAKIEYLEQKQINITEQMEKNLAPTATESPPVPDCESHGGVAVGSKCFIIEVHTPYDTTLAEAKQICRDKNAKLADISAKREYDEIMKYARKKIASNRSYFEIWTGMQRDEDRNAVLSDGLIASYKRVRTATSQWSTAEARRTHVYIRVHQNSKQGDQGLGSIWPDYQLQGSLCMIE